jgi:hypothetical protein
MLFFAQLFFIGSTDRFDWLRFLTQEVEEYKKNSLKTKNTRRVTFDAVSGLHFFPQFDRLAF